MTVAPKSAFQFVDYRIEDLSFSRPTESPAGEKFGVTIQFKTESSEPGMAADSSASEAETEGFDAIRTLVTLKIWLEWEPAPGPFDFELTLSGIFERDKGMDAQMFRDFSEIHAPAILFTHARPIVKFVMSEANEQFSLPLVNISKAIQDERAREASADEPDKASSGK